MESRVGWLFIDWTSYDNYTASLLQSKLILIDFFAYCKGGDFDIHIWALFGYSIC